MLSFRDKKVTLMGLGLLGRGFGDAIFFAKAGAQLTVTDLKNQVDLADSLKKLKKFKNIKFVLGQHRLENFRDADLVVKSAGVPLDSQFIIEAQKNNVPIVMSTALFARLTKAKIIGITGTRGKSTVAYLLFEIVKLWLKTSKKRIRAHIGGNILGLSTIELLNKVKPDDIVVLELDSWQLQGFGGSHDLRFSESDGFSPPVAIFTTFMPDHLNYYRGDMERYFADKSNIYRFQKPKDLLVISSQVAGQIRKYGPKSKSKTIIAQPNVLPKSWRIRIPGEHNRLNVALAVSAARALGIPDSVSRKAVESFKAVPGRLELVRNYGGIRIYNDTNSTTQEATIAGLKALGRDRKTVLIFGGADKKLELSDLLKILPEYTKAAVVLPGTGTDKIRSDLEKIEKNIPVEFVSNMKDALKRSLKHARSSDRILMSPAFASFGIFKNEYDRGEKFIKAVKSLLGQKK